MRSCRLACILGLCVAWGAAMAFTYQGRLTDTGVAANGVYDFQFTLYSVETGGTAAHVPITVDDLTVTDGLFTTELQFSAEAFTGSPVWLEVAVRPGASTGAYTTLSGRQKITAAPFSIISQCLPWEYLMGVPAGFADDVDNDTTYTAGAGLSLSGTTFSLNTGTLDAGYAKLGGNTSGAMMVVGTTDFQPLELRVNDLKVAKFIPRADSPNIVMGHTANYLGGAYCGSAVLAGGMADYPNYINGFYSTIAGGNENHITDSDIYDANAVGYAFIGGGERNSVGWSYASVVGGYNNDANSDYAIIAGGKDNYIAGKYSTVPGGYFNTIYGEYCLAAGYRATVYGAHPGTFVWADKSEYAFDSEAANEFAARATGGVRFVTAVDGSGVPTAGVRLASGGSGWLTISDRNAKTNITPVNSREVLRQVAALPLATWNYKTQDAGIRHLGPMAQDFRAAFGLGESDTAINQIDLDGVSLAAIQGLYQENQDLKADNAHQQKELDQLKARLARLEALMAPQ